MHEAMARYQTVYGLKPIGPHRKLADELFGGVSTECEACGGGGVVGQADWRRRDTCQGRGVLFTRSPAEIDAIRRAGSGKTEVLARRACGCCPRGWIPRGIIAFTFTEEGGRGAQGADRAVEADARFADLPRVCGARVAPPDAAPPVVSGVRQT